jgi:hypothetical protein
MQKLKNGLIVPIVAALLLTSCAGARLISDEPNLKSEQYTIPDYNAEFLECVAESSIIIDDGLPLDEDHQKCTIKALSDWEVLTDRE